MPIDALSVLCAQLTRDLLAIAKFLFSSLWFLQTLVNFYDSWHIVYRGNSKHNNYWFTRLTYVLLLHYLGNKSTAQC